MDKLNRLLQENYKHKQRLVAPLIGFPGLKLNPGSIKLAQQNYTFHIEVIKAIYTKFKPDIIFPLMDLSLEANALGCFTKFPVNESGTVPAPKAEQINLDALKAIDIIADERIGNYIKTVELMIANLPKDVLKGAYIIGPFTLTALIKGADSTATATMLNPNELEELIQICNQKIKDFMIRLIETNIDIICILEPTASLLDPQLFDQFSGRYLSKLFKLSKRKKVISTLHICGNTMQILDKMINTGAEVLSLDSKSAGVDLLKVMGHVPENVCVMGNINPTGTMLTGNASEVKEEVNQLLTDMRSYPNYILSTGCDLPLETKIENITAFMETGRKG